METCWTLQWRHANSVLLNLKKAKKNEASPGFEPGYLRVKIRDGIHSATEDTNLHIFTPLDYNDQHYLTLPCNTFYYFVENGTCEYFNRSWSCNINNYALKSKMLNYAKLCKIQMPFSESENSKTSTDIKFSHFVR